VREDLAQAEMQEDGVAPDDPLAGDPGIAAVIAELGRLFVARLPEDLAKLDRLGAALAAGDLAALAPLRVVAHDLAGCGGSFGYPEISERAAAVDQEAMRLLNSGTPGPGEVPALLAPLVATCREALRLSGG
jgi:hypothetical protein